MSRMAQGQTNLSSMLVAEKIRSILLWTEIFRDLVSHLVLLRDCQLEICCRL